MKTYLLSVMQTIVALHYSLYIHNNITPISKSQSFIIKVIISLKIAIAFSIPTFIIEKATNWTITNSNYIAGVLTCIAIDHIVGTLYHILKLKDFSFKKSAWGLISKLTLCAFAAILFEVIHFTLKDVPLIYEYLKTVTRLVVILYPAGSAFMNMSSLTNGIFPPIGWIKRIKAFNENLDVDKIKNA